MEAHWAQGLPSPQSEYRTPGSTELRQLKDCGWDADQYWNGRTMLHALIKLTSKKVMSQEAMQTDAGFHCIARCWKSATCGLMCHAHADA